MPSNGPSWIKGRQLDLFIESYSNATQVVQVRGFSESEQITHNHTTNTDRSLATSTIQLADFPTHLTVRTAGTSVKRGACYVKVSVRAEGVVVALLFSGYVTDAGTPAYPNGKTESSVEGPGLIRSITGTDPAAGVEISETVPTGARWRLIYLHTDIVVDATVISRQATLDITDGTNSVHHSWAGANITSGQTVHITWGDFGARDSGNTTAYQGMIGNIVKLMAGYIIKTATTNMQAGDNYSTPQLFVEEWIEP